MNLIFTIAYIVVFMFSLFLMMLVFRNRMGAFRKQIDRKKEELIKVIYDAEQMVDEMNKLSEYVVGQIEIKNDELITHLSSLDEKTKEFEKVNSSVNNQQKITQQQTSVIKEINNSNDINKDVTRKEIKQNINTSMNSNVAAKTIDIKVNETPQMPKLINDPLIGDLPLKAMNLVYDKNGKLQADPEDKVIYTKNKNKQVMDLAEQGYNYSEIAKRLNIGKGEVKLILGVNK